MLSQAHPRAWLDGHLVPRASFPEVLSPAVETVAIPDARLLATWGERLSRVVLTVRSPATSGRLTYGVTSG